MIYVYKVMETRIKSNSKADVRNVWDKRWSIFWKQIHMGHWRTIMKTRCRHNELSGGKWLYFCRYRVVRAEVKVNGARYGSL